MQEQEQTERQEGTFEPRTAYGDPSRGEGSPTHGVAAEAADGFVFVLKADGLPEGALRTVHAGGKTLVVTRSEGRVRAYDARCPHMGYPLVKGALESGILRCDWHHWRFDAATGGCLTFGGVDVPTYPVRVVDGRIEVRPLPFQTPSDPLGPVAERLTRAVRDATLFPIAKAVTEYLALGGTSRDLARIVLGFAARRTDGFAPSLTITTALLRHLDLLEPNLRPLALTHAFDQIAQSVRQRPERPVFPALPALEDADGALKRLRTFVDEREIAGAERLLRTALTCGRKDLAQTMLLTAVTDHVFLSTGHVLDETQQALALTEWLGDDPELAGTLLSSVLQDAARADRHEEDIDWQDAREGLAQLDQDLARGDIPLVGTAVSHTEVLTLLEDDLAAVLSHLDRLRATGAGLRDLSWALCDAAVERLGRIPLQNEEDFDDVHHLFTYAAGVRKLVERTGQAGPEARRALMRAIYHGFGYVALTAFLNRPRARFPFERSGQDQALPKTVASLSSALARRDVEQAAQVASALALSEDQEGIGTPGGLGSALLDAVLAEDASFHLYQNVDAMLLLSPDFTESPLDRARLTVGTTRFLASSRRRRRVFMAAQNAQRLVRGDALEIEAGDADGADDPALGTDA